MTDPTGKALALWGMHGAPCRFVAGRENRVYKVDHTGRAFALRFKRPGYRTLQELKSELDWLTAMAHAGLNVPAPIQGKNGSFLQEIGGSYVDLITWLDGIPMGRSGAPLDLPDPVKTFQGLGVEMARLHLACDAWTPPAGFARCDWNADGLLGEAPVWGRFWDNPTLDGATRTMLQQFRAQAASDLAAFDLDAGLIHADLVRENVMIDGQTLRLIDFDDGGFGFRLFDVATALLKNRAEPNYAALKDALIDGYLSIRRLDMGPLDLFLALRAATYVGWIAPRMDEPGAAQRNLRFIKDAQDLCGAYLDATTVS